jgi:hypothetical protein
MKAEALHPIEKMYLIAGANIHKVPELSQIFL